MGRPMSKKAWEQRQHEMNAFFEERSRWFAVNKDGERVSPGDTVTTFRNEQLVFGGISDYPTYGKSGKVFVTDPSLPKGSPLSSREFYPSVINVELRRESHGN